MGWSARVHVCALLAALALAGRAPADVLSVDFSAPAGDDYSVTVIDDVLSSLGAAPANGRLEITGSVVAGSEPKVILAPNATLLAGESWSVEARFEVASAVFGSLAARDSLQTWISIENTIDDDDDARSKSGIVKGPFEVGEMMVGDGYFVSSGFVFDDDSAPGSGESTEYNFIDPAIAGPGSTLTTTLRVEYDASQQELTTLYRLGAGSFVPFPLMEDGMPAPAVDPQDQWQVGPSDELGVFLMFSATRAATGPGESGDITSSFSLSSGDVWIDDLVVTTVPEPRSASPLVVIAALALLTRTRAVFERRDPSREKPELVDTSATWVNGSGRAFLQHLRGSHC